jgi:regulator of protease activity HflC (stomatin/prohibitin superfamily)
VQRVRSARRPGVTFNLAKITLPTELQNAINKAQAAFAAGTQVQARVATADADANAQRPARLSGLSGLRDDRRAEGDPTERDHVRAGQRVRDHSGP